MEKNKVSSHTSTVFQMLYSILQINYLTKNYQQEPWNFEQVATKLDIQSSLLLVTQFIL